MIEKPEPTEEEIERSILRSLGSLCHNIERYIQRRRESRIDAVQTDPGAAKATPGHR